MLFSALLGLLAWGSSVFNRRMVSTSSMSLAQSCSILQLQLQGNDDATAIASLGGFSLTVARTTDVFGHSQHGVSQLQVKADVK